jgi:hypothetical protein
MKKLFFLFALLASIAASATVTVTPLNTDLTNQKVTFRVDYANAANNRAWIWIDLCPVSGVTPSTFQTAVISAVSATGGSVNAASLNGRGFFVTASPSTVTATLGNVSGKFNWCAYGSDYPPNVMASNGTYTLRGTPPFILKDESGATQTVQGKTISASSLTIVPITMTDATGCPGYFCPYVGSDLHFNATYKCQQRTIGEKNWEAYIKDNRDNQIYRITQFSDNSWWFAEDLAIATKRYAVCNGTNLYDGGNKPDCPSGWQIPTIANYGNRYKSITESNSVFDDSYGGGFVAGGYQEIHVNETCGHNNLSCYNVYDNGLNTRIDVVASDIINSSPCTRNAVITEGRSCFYGPNCVDNSRNWTSGRVRCLRQL